VEDAIRVNRAAAERQRRAVAVAAPSDSTSPVLATLEVARLAGGRADGGVDAWSVVRKNGVWCDCRDGEGVGGTAGEAVGGHFHDGGAARVGDGGTTSNEVASVALSRRVGIRRLVNRSGGADGRHDADDVLGPICGDRARTGRSDVGGVVRPPP